MGQHHLYYFMDLSHHFIFCVQVDLSGIIKLACVIIYIHSGWLKSQIMLFCLTLQTARTCGFLREGGRSFICGYFSIWDQ